MGILELLLIGTGFGQRRYSGGHQFWPLSRASVGPQTARNQGAVDLSDHDVGNPRSRSLPRPWGGLRYHPIHNASYGFGGILIGMLRRWHAALWNPPCAEVAGEIERENTPWTLVRALRHPPDKVRNDPPRLVAKVLSRIW